MVAQRMPQPMSVADYHAMERNSHDVKHEYIDGLIYALAGGTANHAHIGHNAVSLLEEALGDSPCNVYSSDLRVRVTEARYVYPDASVTCDEGDQGEIDIVQSPRVVVEVLSESTERYDRGRKFAYYRQCPTLEEYMLVSTDFQMVEVFSRTENGWTAYHAYGPGDEVELASIDVRFSVSALYKRTTVQATPDIPRK